MGKLYGEIIYVIILYNYIWGNYYNGKNAGAAMTYSIVIH